MRKGKRVGQVMLNQTGSIAVLDRLFAQPMVTVNQVKDIIGMTYPVAADS